MVENCTFMGDLLGLCLSLELNKQRVSSPYSWTETETTYGVIWSMLSHLFSMPRIELLMFKNKLLAKIFFLYKMNGMVASSMTDLLKIIFILIIIFPRSIQLFSLSLSPSQSISNQHLKVIFFTAESNQICSDRSEIVRPPQGQHEMESFWNYLINMYARRRNI